MLIKNAHDSEVKQIDARGIFEGRFQAVVGLDGAEATGCSRQSGRNGCGRLHEESLIPPPLRVEGL